MSREPEQRPVPGDREAAMRALRLVYLAHPVAGDVVRNLARARRWLRWAREAHSDVAPIAPWIVDCEVWDEADDTARARGLATCVALVARCDEVWLVGGTVTRGTLYAAAAARAAGVPVVSKIELGAEPPGAVEAGALGIAAVQRAAAAHFGIGAEELRGPRRDHLVSAPRHVAMYVARTVCGASYPVLGRAFGLRDHTSALYACRRVARDGALWAAAQQITRTLGAERA